MKRTRKQPASWLITKKEVEPIISEVVGEAGVKMEGGYSNDGDTPLGNLIADGMRYSMKSDFAMMNEWRRHQTKP
ncbi:hypothetical protein BsIDN1_17000 [Bacillus safensis]|uniref:Uncharacterized protein n=1 Tax=Bacillus safensis TaxID=561879 RepID=A0A5S9M612_BACIA|nr:hypothetical protein BsIDN1_17000 [Bacillus safensis]